MKLSRIIRQKRGSRSLREIARETGLSPATLSRMENDGDASLASLMKLAKWLGFCPLCGCRPGKKKNKRPEIQINIKGDCYWDVKSEEDN